MIEELTEDGRHMDTTQQHEQHPIITLAGDKIALGPPHRGILPLWAKWDNDLMLSILSGDPARPRTFESTEAEYDLYSKGEQRDWVLFVMYERATLRPIGIVELTEINFAHRTALFGIRIGEADCWGRGYGTEATTLMLDYAFNALGLHNIMLDPFAFNERAIRVYQKAGFKLIGHRRQAHRIGDHAYDVVLMDCLSNEFHSSLPRVIELPAIPNQENIP